MINKFNSASKKIQDLIALYSQMDNLPNRSQWHFVPAYKNSEKSAFVFSHPTADADKRYDDLNKLADVLYAAGIKAALVAVDGVISDVIIAPEHTELARKLFARYQMGMKADAKTYDPMLEQEWQHQRQK